MRKPDSPSSKISQGYTLVEILVSIVILLLVLIAVYSFFDQGQWLYLGMEKQTESQQNVRIVVENLERDLRMIGGGVPNSVRVSVPQWWTPFIFTADKSKIYFFADIDSRNTLLTANAGSGAGNVAVEDASVVCPSVGTPLVLVLELKTWQPVQCTGIVGSTINISPATVQAFPASTSTVFSPDTVFYRMTNDSNNDGVCDDLNGDGLTCLDSLTTGADFPFCNIEKAEVFGNDPDLDSDVTTAAFQVMATNICEFKLEYFSTNGLPINGGTVPLTGGFLSAVQRVKATVSAKARSSRGPGQYNDIRLTSDILLRSAKY